MPSALIVASTSSHVDSRETLRLQDLAGVMVDAGWKVDLLVPRASELLTLTLPADVRVATIPPIPLTADPPRRPSIRRMFTGMLMFLRGTALVSRNAYTIVHGVNDGAMIARGAMGNPFIFEQIKSFYATGEYSAPSAAEKMQTAKKHLQLMCEITGDEKTSVIEARKHMAWYLKGLRGGAACKTEIFSATTKQQVLEILNRFITQL